jgi:hypothetical protein
MNTIDEKLQLGLQRLEQSGDNPDLLGIALVTLHGALEDYFRDSLAANPDLPYEQQMLVQDRRQVQWKDLLELIQQYGGLSDADCRRVMQANRQRQIVAHGGRYQGTRVELTQYAYLVQSLIDTHQTPTNTNQARHLEAPVHSDHTAGQINQNSRGQAQAATARRVPLSANLPVRLRRLWIGGGKPALHWRSLFVAVFGLILAAAAYNLALTTLRWPARLQLVGYACLIIALAALFWGLRSLVRTVVQLGFQRLLIGLAALFAAAVFVRALLFPSGEAGVAHWLTSASTVAQAGGKGFASLVGAAIAAPDAISFALTGQRQPIRPAGVDWPGGIAPSPVVINLVAGKPSTAVSARATSAPSVPMTPVPTLALHIGDNVRITGTEGTPLRARATPSTDAKIITRFSAEDLLTIVDGPTVVGGRTWWRVRGKSGVGWCAAEFLTLASPSP